MIRAFFRKNTVEDMFLKGKAVIKSYNGGKLLNRRGFAVGIVLLLFVASSFVGVSNQKTSVDTSKSEIPTDGGLQNSSWPMFHHDVRHTGKSPYGPTGNLGVEKWKFLTNGLQDSSPAIDENGTIYIGSSGDNCLFAINSNGTEKWRFNTGEWVSSSPAIAKDGTIYVGSDNGNLYALNQNGTMKWQTSLGSGWVFSSPAIGNDGTIYAASVVSSRLCAVYPNGSIKWVFYAQNWIYCSPALDQEGNIYIGSNDGYMYAVYPNGTLEWKFYAGGNGIGSPPSITDNGTIYFGGTSGYLYALNPNGTLKWKYYTDYIGGSSPAIDTDGTIYVGSNNGRIYAIRPNGTGKWHYQTNDDISASPAIDKNGIIYCGSWDGNLYALNHNGTLKWKFAAGDHIESSVAIGVDGTIYVAAEFLPPPDFHSYLYALEVIENNPPIKPTITGSTSGKAGQEYNYKVISTDPEGNNISYYVDWGDGTNTGWIGPFNSGYDLTVNHTWSKRGTYTIKAKAKDNYSAESGWGTLSVTMPLSYEPPHFRFFEWLLERFPNAFPILRYLLGFNQ